MDNIAIIIPSRLNAERLPNKPFKLINNKEMILHVHDAAKDSNVGQVIVATPDQEILELIKKHNGQGVLTSNKHETGTDRVFEVFKKELKSKPEIIINFQGDMPNLNPDVIKGLAAHMKKNLCDIGTLASYIANSHEEKDHNVVKVITDKIITNKLQINYKYITQIDTNKLQKKGGGQLPKSKMGRWERGGGGVAQISDTPQKGHEPCEKTRRTAGVVMHI